MKELLKSIYKKLSIKIILITCLVAANVYLMICPSKILGNIIDLLADSAKNKELIINNILLLLGVSLVFIFVRIVWKYLLANTTRTLEKDLKDKLFENFLKIILSSIQDIKNWEIMSYFAKDIG